MNYDFSNMPSPFGGSPAMPQMGGMFGGGGKWQNALLAAVAGFMARRNPSVANNLINGLQSAQELKQRLAYAQMDRQQRNEDQFGNFQRQYDYELAHPKPTNNDTVADYNFWKGVLPPDQFEQYVANKVNPPQLMDVPGVGIVSVPRMASPQGAPTAPVGTLRPYNPGGPTPSASGGFL